jgi:hypothetical protein
VDERSERMLEKEDIKWGSLTNSKLPGIGCVVFEEAKAERLDAGRIKTDSATGFPKPGYDAAMQQCWARQG